MLNIYCWKCGTQVRESDVLGLGHFDRKIGKYQGKKFIAYKCSHCQEVRYQVIAKKDFPKQQQLAAKSDKTAAANTEEVNTDIDINQVIEFYEVLNKIETVDGFLKKCSLSTDRKKPQLKKPISQPLDVYNFFNDYNNLNLKRLLVIILNQDKQLLNWEFMGEGTDRPISFKPKDIYRKAFLMKKKVSIIIADNLKVHSHNPSHKDILLTKRLIKTGKILGIELIDRIVINNKDFKSYDKMDLI